MADPRLLRKVDQVVDRLRRLRRLRVQSVGWIVLALVLMAVAYFLDRGLVLATLGIGVVSVLLVGRLAGRQRDSDRAEAVLLIEQQYPDLDARLVTALQQIPKSGSWNFSFLQSELLSEVFAQLRGQNWVRSVPRSRVVAAQTGHLLGISLFILGAMAAWNIAPQDRPLLQGKFAGGPTTESTSAEWEILVEPGNVELERGTSLVVVARFPGQIPAAAELIAVDQDGETTRVPLRKSLEDPMFGGRIATVERDLTYHISFDGQKSEEFQVSTFIYPDLLRADIQLNYPEYTNLDPKLIEDARRVTLVEGSSLDLTCLLNKPVQSARLLPIESDNQRPQQRDLAVRETDESMRVGSWVAVLPGEQRYELELIDHDGRRNRERAEFRITVLPNQTPDLKVSFPSKDLRASPLQELVLNAEARDDFGLTNLGLTFERPDGTEETIEFGKTAAPDQLVMADHMVPLASLDVQPDDLVSYYFFADDVGPDGQPRRSFSDIFFAEIRPFEEIFRQAPAAPRQPQQQQQQQQESPTGNLLELQRQVVTGAWNVLRQNRGDFLSSTFAEDVTVLAESQEQIQQLATQVVAEIEDAIMKRYGEEAVEYMGQAAKHFATATSDTSREAVVEGRAAAQQAYQALLHLRARETNVANAQTPGSGSMQQQLQALKLKNDRDRYETERQAQQQQENANREDLQVLNRLKELARRQEDLNNRIRELQNALRQAESEEERRELERQLKRLQQEQQELLRNLDEVRERMSREENRERMADARQQAEEARERVVRASEALEQGEMQQALAEGTRAERELNELREDFRKQTAGQFDEAIRELRREVRELSDEQNKIANQLGNPNGENAERQRPSLRDDPANPREDVADQLQQQSQKLDGILERAQQLVVDSETSEPLLSNTLYETLRELPEYQPKEALDNAARMMRFGIDSQARDLERQARRGIDHLQEGIEEAARGLLGSDEEALRLAREELEQLTEAIRQELDQNDPQSGSNGSQQGQNGEQPGEQDGQQPGQQGGNGQPSDEQRESQQSGSGQGQPSDQENQNGQGQQGQRGQQGEGQEGEGQQGEGQQGDGEQGQGNGQGQQSEQQGGQGQGQGQGQQPGENPGQGQGQGQQQNQNGQGGGQGGGQNQDQNPQQVTDALRSFFNAGSSGGGRGGTGPSAPLTGTEYQEWSDRMRDLEEMLVTPELRAQAAAIRERARQERIDLVRHSEPPNWQLVRTSIYEPMLELQTLINEELSRRNPQRQLVPIDRDPVPDKYADLVREYYEQLSRLKPDGQ